MFTVFLCIKNYTQWRRKIINNLTNYSLIAQVQQDTHSETEWKLQQGILVYVSFEVIISANDLATDF